MGDLSKRAKFLEFLGNSLDEIVGYLDRIGLEKRVQGRSYIYYNEYVSIRVVNPHNGKGLLYVDNVHDDLIRNLELRAGCEFRIL